MTKMQLKILKQIVENNFNKNTKIEKIFSLKTTHLVVGTANESSSNDTNSLSPKTLLAILNNCKVVKFDWVSDQFIQNK